MMTKLRETKEEKGGKCEVKVKKNEEKFNFDNYEEIKMEREVKSKKEEERPIVDEFNDEELLKVEKLFLKFVNTINYQRKKGKSTRMQKFNVSKDSFQIFLVDSILNKHILLTESKVKDDIKRRSIIKTLICAAGLTLRKLVCGKLGNNKYNSKINQLRKKERKMMNCIEDLKYLIETNKCRHNIGRRLRKAKVTPTEMIEDYYNKLRYIRNEITACLEEHKKAILRSKFELTPSIKIISNIQNLNEEEELPKEEEFVKYYKELFTSKDVDGKETPHLDNWLKEFSKTLNVDWTISDNEILEALKYCGNFKAPGPDMVMNVCYKWFKSAQNYLIRWIKSTWYGEYRINKKDASAVTYMIWKGNDKPKNDVKSFRPISCLNCDFKLLNKLIANKVYESVEKILPMNQMAVIKGKHGTCEALLLDKSLAQSMKFRRRKDVKEIWCSWIDFSQCYDSISHKCLKKMIQSIKAPPTIHKVILDGIDSWNISICSGKSVSKAKIPVKSGILQGEVASPLYFVLLTGGISYALNKEEQVPIETVTPSNTLKINHISFMDDYQLYATSQKKVEKLTVKLK
uniref:Reverse transcriptase domain-containing protein n=1 Tax=Strongyloides papillosus TaxID=174720 RepID=A0A0N5BF08_STREA